MHTSTPVLILDEGMKIASEQGLDLSLHLLWFAHDVPSLLSTKIPDCCETVSACEFGFFFSSLLRKYPIIHPLIFCVSTSNVVYSV